MISLAKWVIQKTLVGERTLNELTNAIEKSGARLELIELAPFSVELQYENTDEFRPIIYGSTTFMLLAYKHEYLSRGVFFDESTFLMSEYIKHWGQSVLNNDANIIRAGNIKDLKYNEDQMFFVRPNDDSKAFTGTLIGFQDLTTMVDGVIDENPFITQDTELVLCSPKKIGKEWRNIIIQSKVISSCRYRFSGEFNIDEDDVPVDMIHFVESLCNTFTPHDVFVMDVCECEGEYFVIECNCFNGSGIYYKDFSKIVNAVNEYVGNKSYTKIIRSNKGLNSMIIIGLFKEIDGEGFSPIRDLISDEPISNKDAVLRYLKSAPVTAAAPGMMEDKITGKHIKGEMLMHSDGEYTWRSDLIHYVDKYNFQLPPDFIERAISWRMTKPRKIWEKEVQARCEELHKALADEERKKNIIVAAFKKKMPISKAENLLMIAYNDLCEDDYKECEKAYDEWINSDRMTQSIGRVYPKLPYGRMDISNVSDQEREALNSAALEYLETRKITIVCPRCGNTIVFIIDGTYEIVRCVKEGCIGRVGIGI